MKKDNKMIELPEFFVQLTNGLSIQTKAATRFWIAVALVSMLTVMPNQSKEIGETKVDLPFSLGKVERIDFYPFAVLLISILIIGFSSAHFQAVRSRKLIQRAIEALKNDFALPGNIHLQDVFDSINSPSINRIAPIAQILQGNYQFFPESSNCPKGITLISTIYYLLLKLLTMLVMNVFPAFALIYSFLQGGLISWSARPWEIHVIFFWIASVVALLILFQLFILDILFAKRVVKRILAR